jgi:Zn-dependent peptidase ImmA (M78 family)
MLAEIPTDEWTEVLDDVVARLLWEAGIDRPPVDVRLLAERMGLVVAHHRELPARALFVRLAAGPRERTGQGTIVLGHAERPEREQWAIAHEVGESVCWDIFSQLGLDADVASPSAREAVANRVANGLLLPRRWFAADGRAFDWDLFELKDRYATASHELIARRMLEMSPPVVITLCDHGRVVWRRGNTGGRPPGLLPEEHDAWQQAHVTGFPADELLDPLNTGLHRVRAWPVHEPDWKREILRCDIAEGIVQ